MSPFPLECHWMRCCPDTCLHVYICKVRRQWGGWGSSSSFLALPPVLCELELSLSTHVPPLIFDFLDSPLWYPNSINFICDVPPNMLLFSIRCTVLLCFASNIGFNLTWFLIISVTVKMKFWLLAFLSFFMQTTSAILFTKEVEMHYD